MEPDSTLSAVKSSYILLNAELGVYNILLEEIFYNYQYIFKVVILRYWA